MMETRQRWFVLGGLLAATVAAAAWVHGNDNTSGNVVAARERPSSRTQADDGHRTNTKQNDMPRIATEGINSDIRSDSHVQLERLDARTLGKSTRDPFAIPARKVPRAQPKLPAPVIVANSAPPPRPRAPSMPFKYMGKLIDGDETMVFLIHRDRNLVVREGDTIESVYRLDRITDNELILTYLPMNQRQTLNIRKPTTGVLQ
jgi:hypothetical protein